MREATVGGETDAYTYSDMTDVWMLVLDLANKLGQKERYLKSTGNWDESLRRN